MIRISLTIVMFFLFAHLSYCQSDESAQKNVMEILRLLETKYYRPVSSPEIVQGIVRGFKETLADQYVEYYSPKDYASMKEEMEGKYQGIGAMIQYENRMETTSTKFYTVEEIKAGKVKKEDLKERDVKVLKVIAPLSGSPSEKAGLKAGDIILEIAGEPTENFDLQQAVQKLRGPQGSKVTVTVMRPATQERLAIEITRDTFTYQGFHYKILPENIGFVTFKFFHKGFAEQLRKALESLQAANVKGMILDMRECGGGVLDEVMNIAELFLPAGTVVKLQTRESMVEKGVSGKVCFEKPIVMLVSEKTASGAEILAGAFKDRARAILIGTRTHGKGSVQEIFDLPCGGAVKLTVAHYVTPNGNVVEKKGVEPDVHSTQEKEQISLAISLITVMSARNAHEK